MAPALKDPRPKGWSLRPGVHAAAVYDDLVLLDVEADAYFCLPDCADALGPNVGSGDLGRSDPALLDELRDAGLAAPADTAPNAPRIVYPPPRRTARLLSLPPPGWRDLRQAVGSLLDLWLTYRGQSLADLVRRAAPADVGDTAAQPGPAALEVVARFRRWAPFAPVSSKCLLRAYMLLRLLRREGHDARWVFGVTTWPFAAHCWLQVGDVVLEDEADRLALYRTILVV